MDSSRHPTHVAMGCNSMVLTTTAHRFGVGENLDRISPSGSFTIGSEEKSLLSGIHPSGLYSHSLSDKDRGVVISPRIELKGDEELWMRVRRSGNSIARYAVQNYPRNGTVFPSSDLKGGKWKWIRHNLDYWEGDRIHIELSTAQDQAILAKNDERSWFGISASFVAKKGSSNPSVQELQKMREFLGSTYRQKDTLPTFFRRLISDALAAWVKDEMTDAQTQAPRNARQTDAG